MTMRVESWGGEGEGEGEGEGTGEGEGDKGEVEGEGEKGEGEVLKVNCVMKVVRKNKYAGCGNHSAHKLRKRSHIGTGRVRHSSTKRKFLLSHCYKGMHLALQSRASILQVLCDPCPFRPRGQQDT